MLSLMIGIQTAGLRQPLKKAIQTAAQLGVDAIEIDARTDLRPRDMSETGLRQFKKTLDDLSLKVAAVSFPTRRGYDVPEDLDRRVGATKEAMQMAFQLGAPVVINQVGAVPIDPESEEASDDDRRRWQLLVEVLNDLGHFGMRCGCHLAANTGTEPGSDLASLLSHVPEEAVAVNFDPGNLIINGFSAADSLQALGPHVKHFHVRDAVRDLARGRGLEVAVGRGTADFPALLATLEEFDYRGYLTIARTAWEDPMTEISQAIQYLKNL